jgi:fumarylacetoacetase
VPDDSPFPPGGLPLGVFTPGTSRGRKRVGAALGDHVLDLDAAGHLTGRSWTRLFAAPSLNRLLAAGPAAWGEIREWLLETVSTRTDSSGLHDHLWPRSQVRMHLPFQVADYVDFYSSEHHAANVGKILRPAGQPLLPNWRHVPIGYHGRAGTVVPSGAPVYRPKGQYLPDEASTPEYGPTQKLDFEAEIGFVVGVPSQRGEPVPTGRFDQHVFGVCLVNDWSARDLQAWEYVPLGPFLAKSFCTTISPWVVPLAALDRARVPAPPRTVPTLEYLSIDEDWGLDIDIEVELNGTVVSRPPAADLYWTGAHQLAHLTANGASLRTGDLYASGTVSGPEAAQSGSMLELAWNGSRPLQLPDGTERSWLQDGDTLTLRASAPAEDGGRLGFGEVMGTVEPAP